MKVFMLRLHGCDRAVDNPHSTLLGHASDMPRKRGQFHTSDRLANSQPFLFFT